MARVLATVSGVAIKPGVSLNRRWYTREMLAAAVARAQERIAAGETLGLAERREADPGLQPLTQLTHHAAEDDSTRIVGRITSLSLGTGGEVLYEAAIAPTPAGKTIAALLDTADGKPPFLRGVSIRGAWLGKLRRVTGPDGQPAETADGLELDGLDYTATPGVPGAQVTSFAWADGAPEETSGRVLITESVQEARVTITEDTTPAVEAAPPVVPDGVREALRERLTPALPHIFRDGQCATCARAQEATKAPAKPYGDVQYADPGYQSDKQARYPIDTKAHAKSAWSYINQASNAKLYTAAQLKRIKGRILAALKRFGVNVSKGTSESAGWVIEPPAQVGEAVAEFFGADPSTAGSWCIRATNGPVTIDLSSYCMDPADLDVILRAAADAACKALQALDPDMDGDIDVPGAPSADTDHDMPGESAPAGGVTETAPADPAGDTGPAEAGHREDEEAPVAETTENKAAGTQPAAALTAGQIAELAAQAATAAVSKAFETRDAAAKAQEKAARKAAKKAAKEARKAGSAANASGGEGAAATETAGAVDVGALVTEAVQGLVASGTLQVGRKGIAGQPVGEHRAPAGPGGAELTDEQLRGLSADDFADFAGENLDKYIFGGRGKAVHQ